MTTTTHERKKGPAGGRSILRQGAVLAGFVALCFAIAALGGMITSGSVSGWYAEIQKPAWNPPDWVFAPVWTTLYAMIGFAGWLVWRQDDAPLRASALRIWLIQLALNFIWTPLFFGLHEPGIAAMEIGLLWFAVGAFVMVAYRVSKPASLLFVPYWGWLTFAAALNIKIWELNRGVA